MKKRKANVSGLRIQTPYDIAQRYVQAGLSVLPVLADGSKAPACASWNLYRERLPSAHELHEWYSEREDESLGIAIVCGKSSGNLEVIDFDKADLFQLWAEQLKEQRPGLLEQLVLVETPRPGIHVYYRCAHAGGNQKLAMGLESIDTPTGTPKLTTLIEIKGEGGYVLAPGCPGACHESGKTYRRISARPLTSISVVAPTDRDTMLEIARGFNEVRSPPNFGKPRIRVASGSATRDRPGDDFNARASWAEVLEPAGWTFAYERNGVGRWRRPGKAYGVSATTGFHKTSNGDELLIVFSLNARPFETTYEDGTSFGYTKFHAYCLLKHCGDFRAAGRALKRKGYGNGSPPYSNRRFAKPSKRNAFRSSRFRRRPGAGGF